MGGAIRGQLFSAGNVVSTTAAAGGALSVISIENLTGGAGDDSLVGNNAINVLGGGGGADWLVGGPGSDAFDGGAGNDVLVWSNGDGTDLMEGGADSDTVNVNGNVINCRHVSRPAPAGVWTSNAPALARSVSTSAPRKR